MIPIEKAPLHQQFLLAISRGGITPIVNVAYSYFQRPILIIDASYTKIVQLPNKRIGNPAWDQLLSHKAVPPEIISRCAMDFPDMPWRDGNTHFFDWGIAANHPLLSRAVLAEGKIKAVASVLYSDKSYTDGDADAMLLFANALSIEFSRNLKYSYSPQEWLNAFLTSLLEGKRSSPQQVHDWLRQRGTFFTSRYCVLAAKPSKEISDIVAIDICHKISRSSTHIHTVRNDGWIYAIYDGIPKMQTYSSIIDSFTCNERILRHNTLMLGLSEIFENIEEISICRYQAERALILGNKKEVNSKLHRYRDYIIMDILSYAKENIHPRNYLHPAFIMLKCIDREKHSEYSHILRVYLENMCDPIKTCEVLHLHRNALTYRLQKIESLANIDLSDRNTRIHLLFSLMTHNI